MIIMIIVYLVDIMMIKITFIVCAKSIVAMKMMVLSIDVC